MQRVGQNQPVPGGGGSGGSLGTGKQSGGSSQVIGRPRRYPHSIWWYIKWFFYTLSIVFLCLTAVTVAVGKSLYDRLSQIMPDVRSITTQSKAEPTRVYASDGTTLLAEFKGEQRAWIPIDALKVERTRNGQKVIETGNLINATLSIEDARFYTHPGMDAIRIAGAALSNLRNGGAMQGGSTITEQLAVNVYLTRKKTFARRLETALLALQLERRFSKDEILEFYLNEIFYGNRAYGCEAAARTYFRKSARNLSIAEAALLAGLPQQPTRLDPFDHFDRAKARQRLVLRAMLQNHKINYTQYLTAVKDQSIKAKIDDAHEAYISEHSKHERWRAPYFVAYVRQYLQQQYDWSDDYLNKGGLKIYTTLDPKMQEVADDVMKSRLSRIDNKLQGALVCIDPNTGHVLAMYGGRNYYDKKTGQFNRATQARRQPGSTFKPYIYATAMEMGFTPDSIVKDYPLRVRGTREVKRGGKLIKNYDFRNRGAMTFRTAIGMSNNVAATRVLLRVGIQNVIQKAHLMGIHSSLVPYPSLALGASELNLLEHVSAYGVFATRGLRAEATPIERVDNYNGETLIEHTHPVGGARVLSPEAGDKMWDMLRYVVTNGTGRPAGIDGVDVIGKTGTTSDNKDVWFMGATRKLVCGVWMGYDKPRELYGSSGGSWCAPAWRRFMIQALDIWNNRRPIEKMIEDARATRLQRNISEQYKKYVTVTICNESGLLANPNCPDTHKEQFSSAGGPTGAAPTQHCDIHRAPAVSPRTLDNSSDSPQPQPGDLGYDSSTDSSNGEEPSNAREDADSKDTGPTNDDLSTGGETTPADEEPARRGARAGSRVEKLASRAGAGGQDTGVTSTLLNPDDDAGGGSDEVVVTVCADSGMVATRKCPVTLQQFFTASTAPHRRCTMHR